jgi:arylsulfatase A-like enzyme
MKFPGELKPQTNITQPVSHLDLFATIMDYLKLERFDGSDGTSLRRFIEETNINENYDETAVVSEYDPRSPISNTTLSGDGAQMALAMRHRNWKLMMPKLQSSSLPDMMFNLDTDPSEQKNLLGKAARKLTLVEIGKAEHLKIQLIEWMQRNDGVEHLYSNSSYNQVGRGDIAEVTVSTEDAY